MAAVAEEGSVAEIARGYKVHSTVIYKWKRQPLRNAAQAFETAAASNGVS